jgi:phage tail-like protein
VPGPSPGLLYAAVNGVADRKATLESAFTLEHEVIEHKIIGPNGQEIIHLLPGRYRIGALSLRRPFDPGKGNDWYLLWKATKTGAGFPVPVSLVLEDGGGAVRVRWDGRGRVFAYWQQVTRDGFPVEVIRFEFDAGREPVRSATAGLEEPGVPGVNAPTPYVSGIGDARYALADGTSGVPPFVMAAGPAQEAEVIEYQSGSSGGQSSLTKIPGRVNSESIVLRHHPFVTNPFYVRYRQVVQGDILLARKDMTLSLLDSAGNLVFTDQLSNAWPRSYTLRPTDDGLAVEDTEFVYEDLEVQTSP